MMHSSRGLVSILTSRNPQFTFLRSTSSKRTFSISARHHLRTSELTTEQLSNFKANESRLWNDIHSTAKWGTGISYGPGSEQTGMSRLTLTDSDKQARDWFSSTTQELGCKVFTDRIGNMFAIRPGINGRDDPEYLKSAAATFAGSHLDTQPTGGRYDGVLGVCAGVEMLRVLQDNWIETEGPVGVINWTNEEGARFPKSMMGSGVWAETGAKGLSIDEIYDLKEVGGQRKTIKEELDRIGYLGDIPASWKDGVKLGAHFELHIEQGPHLVRANEKVGVVQGVQSYKWFTVTAKGRDCHTGTTGYADRADALHWSSRLIWDMREIADAKGGLASVGIINAHPGSVNTVPGLVKFSLDVRHPQNETRDAIISDIFDHMKKLGQDSQAGRASGVQFSVQEDFASDSINFDADAIQCISDSAKSILQVNDVRKMTSGAGHDSVFASMHCPTAMIFVPCKDGVSHHPEEWCEKDDCATGASVLLQSILRYDRLRHQRGDFS